MFNYAWAQEQIALGNRVRRASIPTVYLRTWQPAWSPWAPVVSIFYVSDDTIASEQPYFPSLDDCFATDWELVP